MLENLHRKHLKMDSQDVVVRKTTVMLEIYVGIKLCASVNFKTLKELCDIHLWVLDLISP